LLAGYDLSTDRLYGHVKTRRGRVEFPAFVRCLRSLHPPQVRIWVVLDNFGPHLSTTTDPGEWAAANNVELGAAPPPGRSELDRLRRAPARASGPGMVRALDRAAEVAGLGAGRVAVGEIPPARLEGLARQGLTANAARGAAYRDAAGNHPGAAGDRGR
jgi:hypothetical protein